MKHKFPDDFLWGVAYSSHQVEGNNSNNDWWEWEKKGKTKEESGWACDSWNRYPVDHKLAQDLGCNAFRLSLEWSRIEPKEGSFSDEAIGHYRKILKDLKKRGMKRCVTLCHYTLPIWFARDYGWENKKAVNLFSNYAEKVVGQLGKEIDILQTMNEPRLVLNRGYLLGSRPPGRKNPIAFLKARKNLINAHIKSYDKIKKIDKRILVGMTQYCNDFEFSEGNKLFLWLTEKVENFYNWKFFDEIGDKQDYIGINYYHGYKISLKPPFISELVEYKIKNDMGWGMWPEGIHEIAMDAWNKYKKPIYILENGAADSEDRMRPKYIREHLKWIRRAISDGADIRGYFHWSILDNFEWDDGYGPKFGLCEVDFKTMDRKPRPSFYEYQKIIKNNGL
jgi:beta-glucosidase